MMVPPMISNEKDRLASLHALRILDTPIEDRFERITRLARRLLSVPIAAISLLDEQRQWFKAVEGLLCSQTSRDVSFCGHTIHAGEMLVVNDARLDERFADNPLVTGEPSIVFYAGQPVRAADGQILGTICVIDRKPRRLSNEDQQILRDLAGLAASELNGTAPAGAQSDLVAQLDAPHRLDLIDPLTRVWNERGLSELLRRSWNAAQQAPHGLALLRININGFARINQQHCRATGDAALCHLTKRMLSAIRGEDTLGRLGDDQFLAILSPFEGENNLPKVADRIMTRVQEAPMTTRTTSVSATVSIGAAMWPHTDANDVEDLLQLAEADLSRANQQNSDVIMPTHAAA